MNRANTNLKFICAFCACLWLSFTAFAQDTRDLTPTQIKIEAQRQRLNSSDAEERRDAVLRLGSLRLPAASRAALPALNDASPIVRATAAKSILSIGAEESVSSLLPLLNDKDEFVRRETAYALGLTRSRAATSALSGRLLNDKEDGVRAAAAVALGEIADEAAVVALVGTLAPELSAPANKKRKREVNVFVLRAAASALGQIKSRAGTAALISVLSNEKLPSDVRRESARSLGLIGDRSAELALRAAATAPDPYLAQIAAEALKKLSRG
ncbi:MAG TPA: HEAT repeat domain-containing protein [Pyrinomonadaceae bacterium]|nr:HEAT repeat domain-containing protein [Pyrinomonadaceae bacterium]